MTKPTQKLMPSHFWDSFPSDAKGPESERSWLMMLWRTKYCDYLAWELVEREAFRYKVEHETFDGFDDHLTEMCDALEGWPLHAQAYLTDIKII